MARRVARDRPAFVGRAATGACRRTCARSRANREVCGRPGRGRCGHAVSGSRTEWADAGRGVRISDGWRWRRSRERGMIPGTVACPTGGPPQVTSGPMSTIAARGRVARLRATRSMEQITTASPDRQPRRWSRPSACALRPMDRMASLASGRHLVLGTRPTDEARHPREVLARPPPRPARGSRAGNPERRDDSGHRSSDEATRTVIVELMAADDDGRPTGPGWTALVSSCGQRHVSRPHRAPPRRPLPVRGHSSAHARVDAPRR